MLTGENIHLYKRVSMGKLVFSFYALYSLVPGVNLIHVCVFLKLSLEIF